ncbi:MAG: hypothetical protein J0M29_03465 [Chitinophagales bacterium]|nr:hypothetical protein [Chitinophagales bacterium]
MKTKYFLGILTLVGFMACKPAEVSLSPDLTAEAMTVKGRNGFQIGQTIQFGQFTTGKVRRGWTQGYDLPFTLRFQKAKEKLSYTQFDPEGRTAHVVCVSKFSSVELPVLGDFFGLPLDYQNCFAGNIALGNTNWDFVLHNPNGDFLRERASAGLARSAGKQIDIQAIRGLKGQPHWMEQLAVYGHEFLLDGKVVAAVSTVNRGKVWISESLDYETRLVIAAMATGILLRTDVESVDMRSAGNAD